MNIHNPNIYFVIFALLFYHSIAIAVNSECGSFVPADGVGPWDYYDPESWKPIPGSKHGSRINIVEVAHFTSNVENLIKGRSAPLAKDLDYTLKRIPNHPRALWAVSRYARRGGKHPEEPNNPRYSIRCYFDRAIRFRPKVHNTHLLYAMHLHLSKQYKSAEKEYLIAESLNPDSTELQYNMGLLYFDIKDYKKAKLYAKKAYDKHHPLQGLKIKLKKAGQWP